MQKPTLWAVLTMPVITSCLQTSLAMPQKHYSSLQPSHCSSYHWIPQALE